VSTHGDGDLDAVVEGAGPAGHAPAGKGGTTGLRAADDSMPGALEDAHSSIRRSGIALGDQNSHEASVGDRRPNV
jgi:hypothetical protein